MIRTVGKSRTLQPVRNNHANPLPSTNADGTVVGIQANQNAFGMWTAADIPQLSGIEIVPMVTAAKSTTFAVYASIPIAETSGIFTYQRICTFTATPGSLPADYATAQLGTDLNYCSISLLVNETGNAAAVLLAGPTGQQSV
ncbi:MAG: hypothetical protein ACK5X3_08890, partial [Pseudomonadota bacterium]